MRGSFRCRRPPTRTSHTLPPPSPRGLPSACERRFLSTAPALAKTGIHEDPPDLRARGLPAPPHCAGAGPLPESHLIPRRLRQPIPPAAAPAGTAGTASAGARNSTGRKCPGSSFCRASTGATAETPTYLLGPSTQAFPPRRRPGLPEVRTFLRVLAFLFDPAVVVKILEHLRLPSSAPPLAPARMPEDEFPFQDTEFAADDFKDPVRHPRQPQTPQRPGRGPP